VTGQDAVDWLKLFFLVFASIWLLAQWSKAIRQKKLKKALKYEPPNIHGAADWANDKALKAAGMFRKKGIPFGYSLESKKEIWRDIRTPVITFGGTGTGKTTQALIPAALSWPHSAVFL